VMGGWGFDDRVGIRLVMGGYGFDDGHMVRLHKGMGLGCRLVKECNLYHRWPTIYRVLMV